MSRLRSSSSWPSATDLSWTGFAGGRADGDEQHVSGFIDRRATQPARFAFRVSERANFRLDSEGLVIESERGTIFLSPPTHSVERRHPKLQLTRDAEYLVHGHDDSPFVVFVAGKRLNFRGSAVGNIRRRPRLSAKARARRRRFEGMLTERGLLAQGHPGVQSDPNYSASRQIDRVARPVMSALFSFILTAMVSFVVGVMLTAYGSDAVHPDESAWFKVIMLTLMVVLLPSLYVSWLKSARIHRGWFYRLEETDEYHPLPFERHHWVDRLPGWTGWIVPAVFVLSLLGMIYTFVFLGDVISSGSP